ncbi:FXSXX-COOH protein [Streptomyces sp. NBC_01335]|uniref:FXSXX-COOH protein n=1 Tax=Streptomyces sp. NBC_01335 TaxID=2903828 RepID=UPI002E0F757F|nr:FXSXX-COOH protein [Streptomyces sp. NBC_01335]
MKTYAFPSSFATAKISRVPLSKIETAGGDVAEKLGRIVSVPGGRSNRTSTFNSAL